MRTFITPAILVIVAGVEGWMDCDVSADDLLATIEEGDNEGIEYEIIDSADFGEYEPSGQDLDGACYVAAGIEEHGLAFAAYVENMGGSMGNEPYAAGDSFDDAYRGEWDSEEDYARSFLDDMGTLEDDGIAAAYFDYEAYTRDLFMSDMFSIEADNGSVYVFWNV